MDRDFHFGTVYVLGRWAGLQPQNALVLASVSQFVDDNTAERVDGTQRMTGHRFSENMTDYPDDPDVWIPFHFLPGLDGETREQKLVCITDSPLARAMTVALPPVEDGAFNEDLAQLGIGLHVYADTWSHGSFSGIFDAGNQISFLQVRRNGDPAFSVPYDEEVRKAAEKASDVTGALGHMCAVHWPDKPYADWATGDDRREGRMNWIAFTEAADALYGVIREKTAGESGCRLTDKQKKKLQDTFSTVVYEINAAYDTAHYDSVADKRLGQWCRKIENNEFEFSDFSPLDKEVYYQPELIINDPDFRAAFYEAAEKHYQWVKEQLNQAGLTDVLKD